MIDQISTGGGAGVTAKSQLDLTKAYTARTEKASAQPETQDSVQLSPSAQARALRREGQSIPQIAIKLGLSIPTVDAFFKD